MKVDHINKVMLVRQPRLSESRAPVVIQVGCPEKRPNGHDYYCAYRVLGLGNDRVRSASGVDQMQALLLALRKMGAELYSCGEYKTGKLYWLEMGNKDLGLPTPENFDISR
ncbi:hypothetical protein FRZ44_17680 [Hypericibacter terrae]|uniref:DUF6968 domain-containing protein n=1 Tax=Hypericibacter terrae TaxID=2602015 RepID=A0A5J6MG52_9PROT|nr:hypothetical protein FRZ44_17680 [Hypericibacter terrae]